MMAMNGEPLSNVLVNSLVLLAECGFLCDRRVALHTAMHRPIDETYPDIGQRLDANVRDRKTLFR
jgi:hypothetical protein